MKLLVLGDTHFSAKKPANRLDEDYLDTLLGKFGQVLGIASKEKCDAIVQVGDFFDSPKVGHYVVSRIIRAIRQFCEVPLYCIYGQHDITAHAASTFQRSPLKVVQASERVTILDQVPIQLKDVRLYGCSYGQEVNDEWVMYSDYFNVLVVHEMITPEALFPGHEIFTPEQALDKYSQFDLVLCGDCHQRFYLINEDGMILNPGAMVRKTLADTDIALEPSVAIVEIDAVDKASKFFSVVIDCKPVEEVLDLSQKVKNTVDKTKLIDFIERLKHVRSEEKAGWRVILDRVMKQKKLDSNRCSSILSIVDEALAEGN